MVSFTNKEAKRGKRERARVRERESVGRSKGKRQGAIIAANPVHFSIMDDTVPVLLWPPLPSCHPPPFPIPLCPPERPKEQKEVDQK